MFQVSVKRIGCVLPALLALTACSAPRYGSVSEEGVREALASPQFAVTPREPGWLLKPEQIHALSEAQVQRVRAILQAATVRRVPEDFYRSEAQGNRGDDSTRLFYLYASSAQCLGGRIIGKKALMDDFELSDAACEELYTLLRPQLKKIPLR